MPSPSRLRNVHGGDGLRVRGPARRHASLRCDKRVEISEVMRATMTSLLINVIGTGAALCSMGSFAPQALKIQRERDASSVSMPMYIVTVVGFTLWVTYGVLLRSLPLVASNLVCMALAAWILVLKLRFGAVENKT
jgi:MtN3 and saliva related transmembrane protein